MAKIIISRGTQVVREVEIDKDRLSLGRQPNNDIVLEHRAVSGRHAVLTEQIDVVFVEDLGSTNGTYINGERIAKRILENGDRITIAKFQIEYIAGPRIRTGPLVASIEVETGPNAGKKLVLTKPLSTLGRPGVQVVAITRRGDAYFFNHVDGALTPLLNGVPVGKTAHRLCDADRIELAGTTMVFCLTAP